ncbi:MAG: UvrD-helicase domain-containing protein [Spirochaetales bacterium]|nr:UvrD-helicase domain-containing protein [Spirochaetales bacterium]
MEKQTANFNLGQKQAITSLQNTVVTAGAGSGKTRVLSERFLWLLETQHIQIDEILSLTFTNKAAAEMYERIYHRLLEEPAEFAKKSLADFHNASISTIDSFSAKIARSAAARFGISQDFVIDEKELYRIASGTSLSLCLKESKRIGLAFLFRQHGFYELAVNILPNIAIDSFSLAEDKNFHHMIQTQIQTCTALLAEKQKLFEYSCLQLSRTAAEAGSKTPGYALFLEQCARFQSLCMNNSFADAFAAAKQFKLEMPKGKTTPVKAELKEIIIHLRTIIEDIHGILAMLMHEPEHADFFDFLNTFQAGINTQKRSLGIVSYRDVAEMAVQALLCDTHLRSLYKQKFKYIMIDEFQDNNILQKNLLYLLAEKTDILGDSIPSAESLEPGKLFFVGDEKQSIYAFRGADVSVFKKLKQELADYGGEVIHLSQNYRSLPGLIHFFNHIFSRVLSAPRHEYDAVFMPLETGLPLNNPVPEIHFFLQEKSEDKNEEQDTGLIRDEQEAFTIARFIRTAVENKSLLIPAENDSVRPAVFRDFVVLLRSTGNQIIFEKMFRQMNIPYNTQGVRSLFLEAPVNDIYAVLQTALHPDDREAYAAFLRSPLVNMSDDGLVSVMLSGVLCFEECILGETDTVKYRRGRELYVYIKERIDTAPITQLVTDIWFRFGYRYLILKNPRYHSFLEYFDYFFELARQADSRGETLEIFLEMVRENLGKYEKLEDIQIIQESEDSVSIMSIHKAKGLEFPVVVLANMGNIGRADPIDPAYAASSEYGLVVNMGGSNYLYRKNREDMKNRKIAELRRLFYVALTRARSHLLLSGVVSSRNKSASTAMLPMLLESLDFSDDRTCTLPQQDFMFFLHQFDEINKDTLYAMAAPVSKPDAPAIINSILKTPVVDRQIESYEYPVSALNRLYTAMTQTGKSKQFKQLPKLPVDDILSTPEEYAAWGTIVHYIIEQQLKGNLSVDSSAEQIHSVLPVSMMSGFDDQIIAIMILQAQDAARRFFLSETGMQCKKAETVHTEYPFLMKYPVGEKTFLFNGIIDLLFILNSTAIVIDFKTDRTVCLEDYTLQLFLYADAAAAITGFPVKTGLFCLRDGSEIPFTGEIDRHWLETVCLENMNTYHNSTSRGPAGV